ncbi:MAG: hypothetical protein K2K05_08365 [Muribaculaceae bacterium]|nr:hypothetical protein [Muribaculaceae bacterium]
MNRFLKTLAGITALSLTACLGETVDYTGPEICPGFPDVPVFYPPEMASAPLSTITQESVENSNEFALKFYLANSKECRGNVCVSPFSVGSVLAMIANGGTGTGRDEILSLLGFEESESGLNALNTHYQTLLSNLPNIEEDISCKFTNSLWCDPTLHPINESFMQTISGHYYAGKVDFAPGGESGKAAINEFVSKNTNGLIREFLSSPLDIDLAFLNTSYFKAGWTYPFFKDKTSKEDFHDIDYKKQKTDFMVNRAILEYAQTEDGTEAVRLNYGNKRQFSMTLILPTTLINHVALDEVLTTENVRQINSNFKHMDMKVKLPKFDVGLNNPNTIDILREMGLEQVCTGKAFFSMISENKPFFLKCFVHAAKLKVDEEGTEGAAASLGGMDYASPGDEIPQKPLEIVFNRPFIFYIQENTTGSILFIGSVKTFS